MLSGWGSESQEKELSWPKRGLDIVLRQLITTSQRQTQRKQVQISHGCSCNKEDLWLLLTCAPDRRNSVSREIKINQGKNE